MGPLEFFLKWKLWRACAGLPKVWNWTSNIIPDLWLLDLFCPIKKKFNPPPNKCILKIGPTIVSSLYLGPYLTLNSRGNVPFSCFFWKYSEKNDFLSMFRLFKAASLEPLAWKVCMDCKRLKYNLHHSIWMSPLHFYFFLVKQRRA